MTTVPSTTPALDAETLYDQLGPAYELAFDVEMRHRSVAWVIDQLKHKKPATFLDIGSGTGKPVCSSLADAGHNVLGIDISSVMVEHARKAVPNAKFEKISFLNFEPGDGTYDAVTVYFSMVQDVSHPQIKSMLRKIYGWLKPGGIFVFGTIAIDEELIEANWLGRSIRGSSFSANNCEKFVHEAGFTIVSREEERIVPQAVEHGLCKEEDQVLPEPWVFLHATKPSQ